MTDGEKFTFIVEKEREITEAVTIHGHKPTTVDKCAVIVTGKHPL